jgi:hypothetical protein
MKKVKHATAEELRPEYKRSDFGTLVRGKYVAQLKERSNVVVIDPRVAEFIPNSATVNAALLSLAEIAKRSVQPAERRARQRRKRRAAS